MNKLYALFALFRQGAAVADPALWKNRQITINMVTALLVAALSAARSFGFDVPVTDSQLMAIAGGVVALLNIVLTVTTSTRVGFRPADGGDDGERLYNVPTASEADVDSANGRRDSRGSFTPE